MADETTQGVNSVDVSDEKINWEWEEIITDEKIDVTEQNEVDQEQPDQGNQDDDREKAGENLSGFLSLAFNYGFALTVPLWEVTKTECEELGAAWSRVIVKYLPFSWLRFIPGGTGGPGVCIECDALLLTIKIVQPRLAAEQGNTEQPNEVKQEPESEPQENIMLDSSQLEADAVNE
jgi:hypothetical protein